MEERRDLRSRAFPSSGAERKVWVANKACFGVSYQRGPTPAGPPPRSLRRLKHEGNSVAARPRAIGASAAAMVAQCRADRGGAHRPRSPLTKSWEWIPSAGPDRKEKTVAMVGMGINACPSLERMPNVRPRGWGARGSDAALEPRRTVLLIARPAWKCADTRSPPGAGQCAGASSGRYRSCR
jgi:hypothetical protein